MIGTSFRRLILTILAGIGMIGGLFTNTMMGTAYAASTAGVVTTGGTVLNIRIGPSAATARTAILPNHSKLTVVCQQAGQKIWGTVRTTNMWDRLPNGTYVSDAFVTRGAAPPVCGAPGAKAPGAGQISPQDVMPMPKPVIGPRTWVNPVVAPQGSAFRTADRPSHDGMDLSTRKNTPIRAAAAGAVITSVCNVSIRTCDVDGSPAVRGCGWYVEIAHVEKVITRYCHMIRQPLVRVGQRVVAGQTIGYVGTSGNSSGPHLHFEVHANATMADRTNAVEPVAFLKSKGVVLGMAPGAKPATPAKTVKPVKKVKQTKPTKHVKPVKPVKKIKLVKPVKPVKLVKPAKHIKPAKPVKAVKPKR